MLWHIIKKEFYQNLITARFIVGTILTIVLVVIITLILIEEYNLKNESYNNNLQQNENHLKDVYVYSEIESRAVKPPEILSIFHGGISRKLGNLVYVRRQETPYQASDDVMDNPLLKIFQYVDIFLIFKLIFSLMALLFAFDLFSGEKENGTLKLMLSSRISRAQLFTGKIFGGMLSLSLTLILGILIHLLVLILSPKVFIAGEIVLRLFIIFIITFFYTCSFFILGALVSALTHRSATSLTMNLFTWVVLVIGLPNIANYTAERLKPIESIKIINEKAEALQKEFEDKLDAYSETNPEPPGGTVISGSTDEYGGYYKFRRANLNQFKFYKHFIPFSENLRQEYADKIYSVRTNFLATLKSQADFVNKSTIFSPVRMYKILMVIMTRTDLENYIDFLNQARMHRAQMLDYFRSKNAYRDTRFFSIMTEQEAPDVTSASVFQDGSEGDRIWERSSIEWQDRPHLSLDDFPRFTFKKENLSRSLQKTLPIFSALIFFNLLFFALGFYCFIRYDVR